MPVPESHHERDSGLGPITDEAAEASAPASRARENGGANREHDDRQDDLKSQTGYETFLSAILADGAVPWCSAYFGFGRGDKAVPLPANSAGNSCHNQNAAVENR